MEAEDFGDDYEFYQEVPAVNVMVNELGEKEVEVLMQDDDEDLTSEQNSYYPEIKRLTNEKNLSLEPQE